MHAATANSFLHETDIEHRYERIVDTAHQTQVIGFSNTSQSLQMAEQVTDTIHTSKNHAKAVTCAKNTA